MIFSKMKKLFYILIFVFIFINTHAYTQLSVNLSLDIPVISETRENNYSISPFPGIGLHYVLKKNGIGIGTGLETKTNQINMVRKDGFMLYKSELKVTDLCIPVYFYAQSDKQIGFNCFGYLGVIMNVLNISKNDKLSIQFTDHEPTFRRNFNEIKHSLSLMIGLGVISHKFIFEYRITHNQIKVNSKRSAYSFIDYSAFMIQLNIGYQL
jgi:hypothetical protein